MENSLKQTALYCLVVVSMLFLNACLSNVENSSPSLVQIGLEMENIDSTYTNGNDSIRVDDVRLILGDSFFLQDNDTLSFNSQARTIEFIPGSSQYANPRAILPFSAFPSGVYRSLNLNIPQAPSRSSQIDPDFFGTNDERYSMIIQGNYNGEYFLYESQRSFTSVFDFSPLLEVQEEGKNYTLVVSANIELWFIEEGGDGLINPRVTQNAPQINDNIEGSFTFEQIES